MNQHHCSLKYFQDVFHKPVLLNPNCHVSFHPARRAGKIPAG